ncbi:B-cell lymphoma 3 protein [Arapaima gigas]
MTMNGSQSAGMSLPLDLRTKARERKGGTEDGPACPESPAEKTSRKETLKEDSRLQTAEVDLDRSTRRFSPSGDLCSSLYKGPLTSPASKCEADVEVSSADGDPKLTKTPVSCLPLRKRPFPTTPDTPESIPPGKKWCSLEQKKDTPEMAVEKSKNGHLREKTDLLHPDNHQENQARIDTNQHLPEVATYSNCGHRLNPFQMSPLFLPMVSFPVPIPPMEVDRFAHDVAIATRQDDDGDTALHIAVVQGREDLVHKLIHILLQAHRDLNINNNLMQTPLHLAVITHQVTLVHMLLEAGADPGALDRNGQTAAHLCCEHGLRTCLELILKHPAALACLKVRNYEGLTPLHLAVQRGDKELVRLLLDHGADIDAVDFKSGRSPLIHAVENNNMEMISILIQNGSNVNAQSYSGNTALHSACGRGQVEAVRMLLRNGADSSLKNYHNDTALMVAKNKKVTDVLRGKGSRNQNPKLVEPSCDSLSPQRCTPQSRQHSIDGTPIQSPSHSLCHSPMATPTPAPRPLSRSPSRSPKAPPLHSPNTQPLEHLPGSESVTGTQENKQQQLQLQKMPPGLLVDSGMVQRMPIRFLQVLQTDLQPPITDGPRFPLSPVPSLPTFYPDPACVLLARSLPETVNHGRHSRLCYGPSHSRPSSRSSDLSDGSTMSVSSGGKDES